MEAKAREERETIEVEPERATRHLRVVPDDEQISTCAASDGSGAAVEIDEEGSERIALRDGRGALLFEYYPETSRCVVFAPPGDLVLRAEGGSIELDAAQGLRLRGGTEVEVDTETLRARAVSAEVEVEAAKVAGHSLTSTFHRVHQTVDVLETAAGRIVERARETYRDVQGLAQVRADRIRHVAERTFHVLGTHTLLKARQDIKLKGEKIHLG